MIVAELRVIPVGSGSSMEKPLKSVVAALEGTGLKYKVGPMGTLIEDSELQPILDAVATVHKAAASGSPRVFIELSIDHRLDKEESIEDLATVAKTH